MTSTAVQRAISGNCASAVEAAPSKVGMGSTMREFRGERWSSSKLITAKAQKYVQEKLSSAQGTPPTFLYLYLQRHTLACLQRMFDFAGMAVSYSPFRDVGFHALHATAASLETHSLTPHTPTHPPTHPPNQPTNHPSTHPPPALPRPVQPNATQLQYDDRVCAAQEECPSAVVQCAHLTAGCSWKGARRDLPSHLECCSYEKIKGLIPRVSASLKQIHTQVSPATSRQGGVCAVGSSH